MNIQPVSMCSNQPDFKARMTKVEITNLLNEVKYTRNIFGDFAIENMPEAFSQIYTLLKRADELPYTHISILSGSNKLLYLKLDGSKTINVAKQKQHKTSRFNLLKDAFVKLHRPSTKHEVYMKMSKNIFKQECWNNRNVTEEDIYKLAIEEKVDNKG